MENIVVSVGAGVYQTPFIERLKWRGYKVAAFGVGNNDPEALKLCDYFKDIDTSDALRAISWLHSLRGKIIAAGSFSGGRAIDTLQAIDREFALSTRLPENISVGMSKISQQYLFNSLSLGCIETYTAETLFNNPGLIDSSLTYIIKPVVGRGSSGVHKVTGRELKNIISMGSLCPKYIVQDFVSGDEYRVLVLVSNHAVKVLSPVKRESKSGGHLLGRLSIDMEVFDTLLEYFNLLVKRMGIENSVIKADVIIGDKVKSVRIIEADVGVCGGFHFLSYISMVEEVDVIESYINLIAGGDIESCLGSAKRSSLVMDYVYLDVECSKCNKDEVRKKVERLIDGSFVLFNEMAERKARGKAKVNSDFFCCVVHSRNDILNGEMERLIAPLVC